MSLLLAGVLIAGCGGSGESPLEGAPEVTPVYSRETGRLQQLTSDRNGDGRIDTWAFMDGRRLERIEIDRDGDGVADRVEHYDVPADPGPAAPFGGAVIAWAEESAGPDRSVTRRELFEDGGLRRVEEDSDGDGRIDRWEEHENGVLVRMDLDLQQRGTPDRRLIYGPRGQVERIEVDADGDGVFDVVPSAEGAGR